MIYGQEKLGNVSYPTLHILVFCSKSSVNAKGICYLIT